MRKQDFTDFRMQKLLDEQASYTFPEFLAQVRRMHGLHRRTVSEETGIEELRLFYLEKGRFKKKVGDDELRLIGDYYGVSCDLLKSKALTFVESGKSLPQYRKQA